MSHARVRIAFAALFAVGVASLLDLRPTRGQEKQEPPAPAAAKPTTFPEPTQFDPKPHSMKVAEEALAVAYSPDGTLLAVGCADKTVVLADPASGKQLGVLAGHADAVAAVCFSRDGTKLASASYDKTVRVWNVAEKKEL